MIESYLGVIASWLAIFAVLDQLCNFDTKIKLKELFVKPIYDHKCWSNDFLNLFELFFQKGKVYKRVLLISSGIFIFLSVLSFTSSDITALNLLAVFNSVVLVSILLLVIDHFSRKTPFNKFGVGYNFYKSRYLTFVVFPILLLVSLVVFEMPLFVWFYFSTNISDVSNTHELAIEYRHSVVNIAVIFLGNFISDYAAIHLTIYFLVKHVKNKTNLVFVLLSDFFLKLFLYLISLIIIVFTFSYESGYKEGVFFGMQLYFNEMTKTYYIFAIISLYSTLASSVWILFFTVGKLLLILLVKYKKFYLKFKQYVRLDNIFTILGFISLPIFLLIISLFKFII